MEGSYRIYRTRGRTIFEIFNYTFFILFCISILVPFIYVISLSTSSYAAVNNKEVGLLPVGFNMRAYVSLAGNIQFLRCVANTVFITVINTVMCIVISLAAGYALASPKMYGRNAIFTYFLIPMYIGGGLIPTYLLITRLHLDNTFWALTITGWVNIFYVIVFKNQISQMPKELIESAQLDGASEPLILFRIILPLLIPMIMAFVVFSAVGNWNSWFSCMIYINDKSKWVLQCQLQEWIADSSLTDTKHIATGVNYVHPQNLQMAALLLAILPILVIYPFCQKYFISGVLVGAVKG